MFVALCRRLGWESSPGESHLDSMLRGELFSALVSFAHEDTIKEAKRRFQVFLHDCDSSLLPADIRKVLDKVSFGLVREILNVRGSPAMVPLH